MYVIHTWEDIEKLYSEENKSGQLKAREYVDTCSVYDKRDYISNHLWIKKQEKIDDIHSYEDQICSQLCANIWILQHKA